MKKLLLALTAISALALTSAFAGEACKKCSGADKAAACTCKDMKSCDKEKASCPKEDKECKDAKPAPSTEKKH
ncbi:MAG: hypothetical protein IPP19_01460 [Verrucomicrobia bacterium]|nr:hypothetical protein [Verrucomicrobiota bacterium]